MRKRLILTALIAAAATTPAAPSQAYSLHDGALHTCQLVGYETAGFRGTVWIQGGPVALLDPNWLVSDPVNWIPPREVAITCTYQTGRDYGTGTQLAQFSSEPRHSVTVLAPAGKDYDPALATSRYLCTKVTWYDFDSHQYWTGYADYDDGTPGIQCGAVAYVTADPYTLLAGPLSEPVNTVDYQG